MEVNYFDFARGCYTWMAEFTAFPQPLACNIQEFRTQMPGPQARVQLQGLASKGLSNTDRKTLGAKLHELREPRCFAR